MLIALYIIHLRFMYDRDMYALYILYERLLGNAEIGYFSGAEEIKDC